jgi:DNA polymerase III epsilon subunit-like protein
MDETNIALVGIPDFIIGNEVLEIKYTNNTTQAHITQLIMYCQMCKCDGKIYNVKMGEVIEYKYDPKFEINNIVRAIGFSNIAKVMHLNNPRKMRLSHFNNTYIAVDFETESKNITEIGAIAFTVTGDILGVYHVLAPGLAVDLSAKKFNKKKFNTASLTGLSAIDMPQIIAAQDRIMHDFKEWMSDTAPLAVVLHYGGNESTMFPNTKDVLDIYKSYNNQSSNNSLDAATMTLLSKGLRSDFEYKSHRAFDDALCTMALFLSIINFSGSI